MKSRRLPVSVLLMRIIFKGVGAIWPSLAARAAYRIWFKSPRYPESKREKKWRKPASTKSVLIAGQNITVYRWGALTPGYVLLVHGWSGRGTQLGGFANKINAVGLGVISFDAPGHGMSDGKSTDIYQITNVVNELSKRYGTPKVIVSHSFGGMVAAQAIRQYQLSVPKLVTISCPMDSYYLSSKFKQHLDLSERVMKLFDQLLKDNLSENIYADTSVEKNLKLHPVDTFIVHDKDDQYVSWRQSEKLSQALPELKILFTNGLGHSRILRDKDVIDAVINFIKVQ